MEDNSITTFETFTEALDEQGVFKDNFGNVYDFQNNTLNEVPGEFIKGANNCKHSVRFVSNDANENKPFVFQMKDITYSSKNLKGSIFIFFLDDNKHLVNAHSGDMSFSVKMNNETNQDKDNSTNNAIEIINNDRMMGEVFYNSIPNKQNNTVKMVPSLSVYESKNHSMFLQHNNNLYKIEYDKTDNCDHLKEFSLKDFKTYDEFLKNNNTDNSEKHYDEFLKKILLREKIFDTQEYVLPVALQDDLLLLHNKEGTLNTISLDRNHFPDFTNLLTVKGIPEGSWFNNPNSISGIDWKYSTNFDIANAQFPREEQPVQNGIANIKNTSSKKENQK
jgi:hypothetical protein